LKNCWCVFDLPADEKEIGALEEEAAAQGFWDVQETAQGKMQRLSDLKGKVENWQTLENQAASLEELLIISIEEEDDSLLGIFVQELAQIQRKLGELEFDLTLSGAYDERNAIVALHAGAGGVESQDWASMLMRMYLRWAEQHSFRRDVLDVSVGDEAGIKSAVFQVSGKFAYGYLQAERGVHRLVRLSPFDSDHARHTSFALLEVLPEVEEGVDVTISPDDLRIDVFRAGGHGGQNVQKNSTAVRITHLPTGIRVSCQNERSQHQNREIAMRILMARLVEREMAEKAREMAKLKGEHVSPEWGNQIRSYVLHPYKMVKDHRTGYDTSDADAVLDGELDDFIKAWLTTKIGNDESTS
jgi:peptide chain release factor 2